MLTYYKLQWHGHQNMHHVYGTYQIQQTIVCLEPSYNRYVQWTFMNVRGKCSLSSFPALPARLSQSYVSAAGWGTERCRSRLPSSQYKQKCQQTKTEVKRACTLCNASGLFKGSCLSGNYPGIYVYAGYYLSEKYQTLHVFETLPPQCLQEGKPLKRETCPHAYHMSIFYSMTQFVMLWVADMWRKMHDDTVMCMQHGECFGRIAR